jgi:hypothetical protein
VPDLSTGEAFRAVHGALCDPARWCARITDGAPVGLRAMEPMERWQTRAVLAALAALKSAAPGRDPMELSYNEGIVLDVVRQQCRHGDYVTTGTVRNQARTVPYDSVDRALKALLKKGLVIKPSRGTWMLPDADQEED